MEFGIEKMNNSKSKIRVGLVFGGRSGEHEVSIASARSIYQVLDKSKYEVVLTGIDKGGNWHILGKEWLLAAGLTRLALPAEERGKLVPAEIKENQQIDVFFPMVHGTYGEDGCLQGLFELLDVAYVGAGVLGSAVGMDKDVQKRLLMQVGIKVAKYIKVQSGEGSRFKVQGLKYPVFVKPANMGSSVGISKCMSKSKLQVAIKNAFLYDTKVIVEEMVVGREIEVAVLDGKASIPGEIIPKGHEFYDYEAKYLDENGAEIKIPVSRLRKSKLKEIQMVAEKVFSVLECEGMARVDIFLTSNGEIVVNEINTLPGFTEISMYPKMWEASGLLYPKLLDNLISLALARKKKKDLLKRSY